MEFFNHFDYNRPIDGERKDAAERKILKRQGSVDHLQN